MTDRANCSISLTTIEFYRSLVEYYGLNNIFIFPHIVTEHANHAKDNLSEVNIAKYDG